MSKPTKPPKVIRLCPRMLARGYSMRMAILNWGDCAQSRAQHAQPVTAALFCRGCKGALVYRRAQ